MKLAVDVGNTHTMLGLYEEGDLRSRWRVRTRPGVTRDEIWAQWKNLMGDALHRDLDVLVACVVPDVTEALLDLQGRYLRDRPWMLEPPWNHLPLEVGTRQPEAVGADRVAGAVALFERHGAGIVVDFGTATTLDFVDDAACYRGGVILPGLEASARGLSNETAKLPLISLRPPEDFQCSDTREGLLSGLYYGTAGAVERIVRELSGTFDVPERHRVVATGGAAKPFLDLCPSITDHAPNLVLDGLIRCYRAIGGS